MIIAALIKNGEKSIGDSLSPAEQAHYLSMLQAMIDSWGLERGWCYQVTEDSFAAVVSTASYTLGPSGTAASTRPTKITGMHVRDSSGYDHPITMLPEQQFNMIPNKLAYSEFPSYAYYDNGYSTVSQATLQLYPIPTKTYTIYIESWKQLQTFSSITANLIMPPGYQRAIEFNFCLESAPGLKSVMPEVVRAARESKAAVKGINLPDVILSADNMPGVYRKFNVLDGP
jgi:hypothetical protein